MSEFLPNKATNASCYDWEYDPDWWFPLETSRNRRWSRTPDAMKARAICASCPIIKSCRDYSLRYDVIYGIWAGLDRHERYDLQKKLGIKPESFLDSYRPFMEYANRKVASHG